MLWVKVIKRGDLRQNILYLFAVKMISYETRYFADRRTQAFERCRNA